MNESDVVKLAEIDRKIEELSRRERVIGRAMVSAIIATALVALALAFGRIEVFTATILFSGIAISLSVLSVLHNG